MASVCGFQSECRLRGTYAAWWYLSHPHHVSQNVLDARGDWNAQIVSSHNLDEIIAIELKRPGLIFPYVRSVVKVIGSESSGLRLQCYPSFQCENLGHYVMADRKSTRLNSSHLGISYAVF